jgi:hypothetical protein
MLSVIKESLAYNKIPSYLREQKLFFTPPHIATIFVS